MSKKLIFIYNADSGRLNGLKHSLHKLISPNTYSCSLCRLTHGFFSEKEMWSKYLEELSLSADFYHKDEFSASDSYELPVILIEENAQQHVLLSAKEMSSLKDLESLITRLKEVLGK